MQSKVDRAREKMAKSDSDVDWALVQFYDRTAKNRDNRLFLQGRRAAR